MSKKVFLFQVADGAAGQMYARQRFKKKSHFKEEKLVNEIWYCEKKREWMLEMIKYKVG